MLLFNNMIILMAVNNELLFYSGTNNIFDLSINSDIESYLSKKSIIIELVLYEK